MSLFQENPSVSMCLLRCPLTESKLLQQWFSERNCGAWGERGDILPSALYIFLCCFQFSFCNKQREKHAHQKDSIGCALWWLQDCCLFCQRKLGWFVSMKLSEAGYSFNLCRYFPGYYRVFENICFYICSKKPLSTSGIKATQNAFLTNSFHPL